MYFRWGSIRTKAARRTEGSEIETETTEIGGEIGMKPAVAAAAVTKEKSRQSGEMSMLSQLKGLVINTKPCEMMNTVQYAPHILKVSSN